MSYFVESITHVYIYKQLSTYDFKFLEPFKSYKKFQVIVISIILPYSDRKLADFVVPNSSKKILEDGEQGLYTVTMFRKTLEAFKNSARDRKFIVR